jgi:membrane-associated protease RseP (regulator of RpoE activity)
MQINLVPGKGKPMRYFFNLVVAAAMLGGIGLVHGETPVSAQGGGQENRQVVGRATWRADTVVAQGGAADDAGTEVGEIILSANGTAISSTTHLTNALSNAGGTAQLTVIDK